MQGHEQPEKPPTRWPASTTSRQPPSRRETRAPPRPAATTTLANTPPPPKQIPSASSPAPPLHDRRSKTRGAVLAGGFDALRALAGDSRPIAAPSDIKIALGTGGCPQRPSPPHGAPWTFFLFLIFRFGSDSDRLEGEAG